MAAIFNGLQRSPQGPHRARRSRRDPRPDRSPGGSRPPDRSAAAGSRPPARLSIADSVTEMPGPKSSAANRRARAERSRASAPGYARPARAAIILDEPKPEPPPTHLLDSRQSRQPGPEVAPAVPAVLVPQQPDFPAHRRTSLPPAHAGPLDCAQRRQSAHRPRDRQPRLAVSLRRRPGAHAERFRRHGRAAHASRAARLARRLVRRHGWSHQEASPADPDQQHLSHEQALERDYGAKDPEDRLLWRMPYRRLEVEAIRDSMLAVSGQLNPQDVRAQHVSADSARRRSKATATRTRSGSLRRTRSFPAHGSMRS